MARIESVKVAGYYPAPARLLSSFASTLTLPSSPDARRWGSLVLLDPCAGEGDAILGLRDIWKAANPHLTFDVEAFELEGERAAKLSDRLGSGYYKPSRQADAFCIEWSGDGAMLALHNPPYDQDRGYGRLEHRFLVRVTQALHPGRGYLMHLVPGHALAASAEHLASHFDDIRCWRLPDPEYGHFGQVLLVARRREEPIPPGAEAALIREWAAHPDALPVLEERCSNPVEVDLAQHYSLTGKVRQLDVEEVVKGFRPWEGTTIGLGEMRDLLGGRIRVTMPPKPTHIAMVLAAGAFNGHELRPNDAARHRPILAKGVFRRELVTVDEKKDKEGKVTGAVRVERPKLELAVLDLDTYQYHQLAAGTTPTGSPEMARWNAADVIVNYDRGLSDLLRRQFPPVHDPSDPEHELPLPVLARAPFRAQRHAIQAALKLLAMGQNPFFDAEVGSGKSIMSIYVAASLTPAWRQPIVDALARMGFTVKLPVVKRTLVVCPPHLLKSWTDQVLATIPEARVQVLDSAADIEKEADFYLLSRERGKLGHGIRGLAGSCPRCGTPIDAPPDELATRRVRCQARTTRGRDALARAAQRLAAAMWPAMPRNALVASLLPPRLAARERVPGSLKLDLVVDVLGTLLHAAHGHLDYRLVEWIEGLARCLGQEERIASYLETHFASGATGYIVEHTIADLREPAEDPLDVEKTLRQVLEGIRGAGKWETSEPCGEPLFAPAPPRRVALARHIVRRCRRRFSLLVADEAQEYANGSSAQSKALHRLTALPGVPTIVLSGSLCSGYSSSVFTTWWSLSKAFRREFQRSDKASFIRRYGYEKVLVETKDVAPSRFGAQSDRELDGRRVIGEAPGVAPQFVVRHLLPTCVVLHKTDMEVDLPPMTETPVKVVAETAEDEALIAEYKRIERELLHRIGADRFVKDRAGRLLGALVDLMSYVDRCTDDLPEFIVKYPESCGGEVIATARMFPSSWRTPKERYLLRELRDRLAAGERCLVFVQHTQTGLAQRLVRLIAQEVTGRVAYLDASKVSTAKREGWIEEQIKKGVKALVSNPNSIRTGLNCLVAFSTAIWHELDYSALCWRQANGRLHRYGQAKRVSIQLPFYGGTAQEVAKDLVAKKTTASEQFDGINMEAALEAAGATSDRVAVETLLSIGEMVYRALSSPAGGAAA
ncbi:MAG: DUF6094 domain-containing protein [Acidobacteriota bacterium]